MIRSILQATSLSLSLSLSPHIYLCLSPYINFSVLYRVLWHQDTSERVVLWHQDTSEGVVLWHQYTSERVVPIIATVLARYQLQLAGVCLSGMFSWWQWYRLFHGPFIHLSWGSDWFHGPFIHLCWGSDWSMALLSIYPEVLIGPWPFYPSMLRFWLVNGPFIHLSSGS